MYHIVDFSRIDAPHATLMYFQLPYHEWCKFENSKLFHDLIRYLEESEKQDSQSEKLKNSDR